jgi:hypothetical protein
MKRLFLASSIVLGILACYLVLLGIQWLTSPRPQYPAYPHVDSRIMHAESRQYGQVIPAQLEFRTHDPAATVRAWYTTTLEQDWWISTQDRPDRLVFERTWAELKVREVLTITLSVSAPAAVITGVVSYHTLPLAVCEPPAFC